VIIAIDPGNARNEGECACAFFDAGKMVRLGYFDYDNARAYAKRSHQDDAAVVVELPMIYPGGHQRPNDLINLAAAGFLVAGAFQAKRIVRYTPREWKGQKPKPPCHWLAWQVLTPAERRLFPVDTEARIKNGIEVNAPRLYKQPLKEYSFKAHNLLDACAIGLFHLGRVS
jgi:hypothetical protein